MKWNETEASKCRYGDIAEKIWKDWEILWEDSEADYQGHASFLAKKGNKYCFYEWWYGSCSGCDGWEADEWDEDKIESEMRNTAMWFNNKTQLKNWLDMLDGNPISNHDMNRGGGIAAGVDILGGGIRDRINAIRKELDMPPLEVKEK